MPPPGPVLPGAAPGAPVPKPPEDPPQLVESIMKLFDRWARLLEEQPTEKVHKPFVQELHSGGLLKVRRAGGWPRLLGGRGHGGVVLLLWARAVLYAKAHEWLASGAPQAPTLW